MYLVDPSSLPTLMILPILIAHAGGVLGGFYGGARLIRAGRERAMRYGLAAAPLVVVALGWLTWGRIGRYGTYGEFHDGRALRLMEVKLGYVLLGVLLGVAAATTFTVLDLLRDSRRVRAR
jgi:hypothetical protein